MPYHLFDDDEPYNRLPPNTKLYCDPPPEGLVNVVHEVSKFLNKHLRNVQWQGTVEDWAHALHIYQVCKASLPLGYPTSLQPFNQAVWDGFACFSRLAADNNRSSTDIFQALRTLSYKREEQNLSQILVPSRAAQINRALQSMGVNIQPQASNVQPSEPTEQKKNMANEKLVETKSKTKTPKEQVSLIGGAMSEGVTMGFTNKTGDILLDLAASVLPNNEQVQAALKDPTSQALIKVVMAVLLHTACESGAPIPASEHVARAARAQITFSTALLTGFLLTDAAVQLTALAEIGRKFAEVENKSE